jgi:dihydroflavonol-4-reductase
VQPHVGDVTDPASVAAALPPSVDAVFHAAASTNLWAVRNEEQNRVNVAGTRNVLEAAMAAGAGRFIHTSSFVSWGFQDVVLHEDSPRTDATDWINYVRTKHLSEQLVLDAAGDGRVDAVVLNPGNILGPGDRHNWSRLFRMLSERSLPGAPPGGGNFCDVREVARAHVRAWRSGRSGARYLLGGEFARYLEVLRIAAEILGTPAPRRAMPGWLLKAAARAGDAWSRLSRREPEVTPEAAAIATFAIRCESCRAVSELDYRSVPLSDMVRDTIDWMREASLLP